MKELLFDYINSDPMNELQSAWERIPSDKYAKFGSLKGRNVCVWKTLYHTVAIPLKPICYMAVGLTCLVAHACFAALDFKMKLSYSRFGTLFIVTGLVAPVGQILQLFKAAMGILHPGCYFRENECSVYFTQLVKIAEEVACEPELIETFQKGASIIEICLQTSGASSYYEALFKRDLAIICERLSDPSLPQEEKLGILNMFASLPSDPRESGIQACGPALGRLLEQICGCLDIPKEPQKVLPWLATQIKEEILHHIVMQEESLGKRLCIIELPDLANLPNSTPNPEFDIDIAIDAAHFGNILIAMLGEKIGLPQEMINSAFQDPIVKVSVLPENEQQELLDLFNQSYTKDFLEKYLMERINSQPDGRPGLKDLRNYMVQKLYAQVPEEKRESSKKDVQDKFDIGEALADDPIFYIKLHYFLYPDADPSDEKAFDFNIEGIKAFAATLDHNPFDYFNRESDLNEDSVAPF